MKASRKAKVTHKPKATRETIKARVDDILRIILDGAQPWDCASYVSDREAAGEPPWTVPPGGKPLSARQVRRYIGQAERLIGESCQVDRKALIRRHLAQRRQLFARCVAKGDERTALAYARDEAELLSLYPPTRSEVLGPNGGSLQVTVEAVAQMSAVERIANVRQLIAAARSRQAALPYCTTGNGAAEYADGAGGTNGK